MSDKGCPAVVSLWSYSTIKSTGGYMKFAQTVCVGLFFAIIGALSTLAYSDPTNFQRVFIVTMIAFSIGTFAVIVFETGFSRGSVDQFRACSRNANADIVKSPVPDWFKVLGILLYGAALLLWLISHVTHPRQVQAAPDPQGNSAKADSSAGNGSKP